MATDQPSPVTQRKYEVYECDDIVLPKEELADPCPIRVELHGDQVVLHVGHRQWFWSRSTGECEAGMLMQETAWTDEELASFAEQASAAQPEPTEHLIRAMSTEGVSPSLSAGQGTPWDFEYALERLCEAVHDSAVMDEEFTEVEQRREASARIAEARLAVRAFVASVPDPALLEEQILAWFKLQPDCTHLKSAHAYKLATFLRGKSNANR